MTHHQPSISEPHIIIRFLTDEADFRVDDAIVVVNASNQPIHVENQVIGLPDSRIVMSTTLRNLEKAVIVERFADHPDSDALFAKIRETWPLVYARQPEESRKGKKHSLSPKALVEKRPLKSISHFSCAFVIGNTSITATYQSRKFITKSLVSAGCSNVPKKT